MTILQALSKSIRAVADDKAEVLRLANDAISDNPDDAAVAEFAGRCKGAKDGTAVRAICDTVK